MSIIFAAIIFLFSLFAISKDDFLLLRKNITMQIIFDTTFFVMLSGLFFARLFYVFAHFSSAYLNPLVFFIIPYFPGLFPSGLICGGCIVLYGIIMNKKYPLGKLFDTFSSAFQISVGFYFLEIAFTWFYTKNTLHGFIFGFLSLFLFLILYMLHKVVAQFSWRDGTLSLLSLTVVSLCFLGIDLFSVKFHSLPVEFPFFLFIFFVLFLSFLLKEFRNVKGKYE